MTILIIKTNAELLHDLEFVKPIEQIIKENFKTIHYSKISEADLKKADKIIICGTSLKDNKFLKDIKKFDWIKNFEKPIFGICAGMQIISLVFGGKIKKKKEIGMKKIKLRKNFLGMKNDFEGYLLHKLSAKSLHNFEILADSGTDVVAVKHKTENIYGVLFHPEVRNKNLIENFIKL